MRSARRPTPRALLRSPILRAPPNEPTGARRVARSADADVPRFAPAPRGGVFHASGEREAGVPRAPRGNARRRRRRGRAPRPRRGLRGDARERPGPSRRASHRASGRQGEERTSPRRRRAFPRGGVVVPRHLVRRRRRHLEHHRLVRHDPRRGGASGSRRALRVVRWVQGFGARVGRAEHARAVGAGLVRDADVSDARGVESAPRLRQPIQRQGVAARSGRLRSAANVDDLVTFVLDATVDTDVVRDPILDVPPLEELPR